MRRALGLAASLCVTALAWGQDLKLGVARELTLGGPWTAPVALEFPEEGRYRLEALEVGGDPVEVVVERRAAGKTWTPEATNRAAGGGVLAAVEWSVGSGAQWRVRQVNPGGAAVVVRLGRATFAGLKETLKRGLTPGPEVSLPLVKRIELPVGTGGPVLTAVEGTGAALFLAWLSDDGSAAQVWDTAPRRWGAPLRAAPGLRWNALELEPGPGLVVRGTEGAQAWSWSGGDWVAEAAPAPQALTTPHGAFRWTGPEVRIWRWSDGWDDLGLPLHRGLDVVRVGSTDDGLYVLLTSNQSQDRAFYSWTRGRGWEALEVPPAWGTSNPEMAALSNGAGSLFLVEGTADRLRLTAFDGETWRRPVDLSPLVAAPLRGLALAPPSNWSRTGALALATDRVTVYDLP